jgi:hypothetical protein
MDEPYLSWQWTATDIILLEKYFRVVITVNTNFGRRQLDLGCLPGWDT